MVTLHIQNRVSQRDSARPALRSALNSVAQQPDFSQDAHADQQVNPLPQTLEEYRAAIATHHSPSTGQPDEPAAPED